jgi:CubicO group peptidase (beta-lactamase class C family)
MAYGAAGRGVTVHGQVAAGFEAVREEFAGALRRRRQRGGTGAAVAVRHDGRWVADLWGGWADAAGTRAWLADSVVQPYSVTKAFAAVGALVLVDRGRLDLDAPVRRYWPEFRAPATVRQVLSHQAGVVALDQPVPTEAFYDWDRLCGLLAAQEPQWEPGTAHGECALFYGHLAGELVRRVDGRRPGRFLREEVCGPLGLDFTIGLDEAERARAVELTGLDDRFRTENAAGRPELYRRAVGNPPGAQDAAVVNGASWRAAEVPAVNGHGTARAVAGLYAALPAGRLLSRGLLNEATTAQRTGVDLVLGGAVSWGLGFSLDGDDFGMGGLGGSYGGASPEGGYAFAFLTGTMGTHADAIAIENALRGCIGLPPVEP